MRKNHIQRTVLMIVQYYLVKVKIRLNKKRSNEKHALCKRKSKRIAEDD